LGSAREGAFVAPHRRPLARTQSLRLAHAVKDDGDRRLEEFARPLARRCVKGDLHVVEAMPLELVAHQAP
jgi:hypothetical protein